MEHAIHDWGYAAVIGGILLENLGLPLPGETLLIAGALAAAKGALDIRLLLPLSWLAALVGTALAWALGQWGGHRLIVRYGARIGITPPRLAQVEGAFARWGDYLILAARFVVVLRQLSGLVAGTLEMGWTRFLLLNIAGAALWVLVWGCGTFVLGARLLRFVRGAGRIEEALAAIAVAAIAIVAIRKWLERRSA